jgi:hypothetical protein
VIQTQREASSNRRVIWERNPSDTDARERRLLTAVRSGSEIRVIQTQREASCNRRVIRERNPSDIDARERRLLTAVRSGSEIHVLFLIYYKLTILSVCQRIKCLCSSNKQVRYVYSVKWSMYNN